MKNWSRYDPVSEDAVMPLADWLQLVRLPLWRSRLQPDYLDRVAEYRADFLDELVAMGKTGPFWQVG